jgi:hypothetical protein
MRSGKMPRLLFSANLLFFPATSRSRQLGVGRPPAPRGVRRGEPARVVEGLWCRGTLCVRGSDQGVLRGLDGPDGPDIPLSLSTKRFSLLVKPHPSV